MIRLCVWSCKHRSRALADVDIKHQNEEKVWYKVFKGGMNVGYRRAGLNISETARLPGTFRHTQLSPKFTQKGAKNTLWAKGRSAVWNRDQSLLEHTSNLTRSGIWGYFLIQTRQLKTEKRPGDDRRWNGCGLLLCVHSLKVQCFVCAEMNRTGEVLSLLCYIWTHASLEKIPNN